MMDEIVDGMVTTFHLSNGQTIVAKIEQQDDDGFHIVKPMELIASPSQQGVKAMYVPYLSTFGLFPAIDEMILPYADVLLPRATPAPLEAKYREDTGMIAVPPKPGLVLVTP
jgi:hypothetical protein